MKKVICDVFNGYDSRIREIRLTFNTDKLKRLDWEYTVLTAAVKYVRSQKSLNGGKLGVYTFNSASSFISFLKSLNLSDTYLNEIWKGFEENDKLADDLDLFLINDDVVCCNYDAAVKALKEMYDKNKED